LSINKRISELIELLENGNQFSFCKKTGISTTTLQGIIGQRQSDPGSKILNRVLVTYPNVNARWIVVGDEDVFINNNLKSEISLSTNVISVNEPEAIYNKTCILCREKDERIKLLTHITDRQEKEIDRLLSQKQGQ
jgi:hypothetical protein